MLEISYLQLFVLLCTCMSVIHTQIFITSRVWSLFVSFCRLAC